MLSHTEPLKFFCFTRSTRFISLWCTRTRFESARISTKKVTKLFFRKPGDVVHYVAQTRIVHLRDTPENQKDSIWDTWLASTAKSVDCYGGYQAPASTPAVHCRFAIPRRGVFCSGLGVWRIRRETSWTRAPPATTPTVSCHECGCVCLRRSVTSGPPLWKLLNTAVVTHSNFVVRMWCGQRNLWHDEEPQQWSTTTFLSTTRCSCHPSRLWALFYKGPRQIDIVRAGWDSWHFRTKHTRIGRITWSRIDRIVWKEMATQRGRFWHQGCNAILARCKQGGAIDHWRGSRRGTEQLSRWPGCNFNVSHRSRHKTTQIDAFKMLNTLYLSSLLLAWAKRRIWETQALQGPRRWFSFSVLCSWCVVIVASR